MSLATLPFTHELQLATQTNLDLSVPSAVLHLLLIPCPTIFCHPPQPPTSPLALEVAVAVAASVAADLITPCCFVCPFKVGSELQGDAVPMLEVTWGIPD